MQAQTSQQGPMYFPMDKVGPTSDDPVFLLNQQNTTSSSNLIGDSSTSLRSPNSATGNSSDNLQKAKYTRLARILSILIIVVSIVMCVVGVINTIWVTSLYSDDATCMAKALGEITGSSASLIFIWIIVSPGIWASIPSLVAGIALLVSRRTPKKVAAADYNPGLPIELQNTLRNYSSSPDVYRVFAVLSVTFCLPLALLLGVGDALLSQPCSTENIVKVIFPVIVVITAAIDFALLLVAWYGIKDSTDWEYEYIGSTYTIYECYEPLLKEPSVINTNAPIATGVVPQQCCSKDNSSPIVIINQPPCPQPCAAPINVLVHADHNDIRRRPPPRPRPLPRPVAVPVPVPVPRPVFPLFRRPIAQQRYYPNQMYGPPSEGILGRPNAYRGMFLPGSGANSSPYAQFRPR